MTGGKNVTPQNDAEDAESIEALNNATQKRSRFKFSMIGLKPGETLEYVRDNSITAKIVDDRSIEIDGNITHFFVGLRITP